MAANNYPGSRLYSHAELAAIVNQGPEYLISWCAYRNPTAVYKFLNRNFPAFGRLANGMWATTDGINQMYSYLIKQYDAIDDATQAKQLLAALSASVPDAYEQLNWTTPKN